MMQSLQRVKGSFMTATSVIDKRYHQECTDGQIEPSYSCNAVSAWKLYTNVQGRAVSTLFFKTFGGSLSEDERNIVFDMFEIEAKTKSEFIAVYDLLSGLDSFASHLHAMIKFCLGLRPVTDKSLLFTVVILGSVATRAILSGIFKIVPPSKPFYIVATEEEAWKLIEEGGGSEKEKWTAASDEVFSAQASAIFASI